LGSSKIVVVHQTKIAGWGCRESRGIRGGRGKNFYNSISEKEVVQHGRNKLHAY